jgi:hypothetical protein
MKTRHKIPDLTVDQRVRIAPAVKEWSNATAYLLQAIHHGSYGVRHRHRLSAAYRERLAAKRRKAQAAGVRCQAARPFPEIPPYSQRKALCVKLVLDSYYATVTAGLSASYSEYVARAFWLIIFGKSACSKTLRNRISRVERCGGSELAPIEAYADRTMPYRKARKLVEPV